FVGEGEGEQGDRTGQGWSLGARAEYLQSALVPSLMGGALDLCDPLLGSHLVTGNLIVVPDTGDDRAVAGAAFVRLGVRALVFAPITHKGRLVAALGLEQFDHPRRFTSEELRLIRL